MIGSLFVIVVLFSLAHCCRADSCSCDDEGED
jgi:hypothetical protein